MDSVLENIAVPLVDVLVQAHKLALDVMFTAEQEFNEIENQIAELIDRREKARDRNGEANNLQRSINRAYEMITDEKEIKHDEYMFDFASLSYKMKTTAADNPAE